MINKVKKLKEEQEQTLSVIRQQLQVYRNQVLQLQSYIRQQEIAEQQAVGQLQALNNILQEEVEKSDKDEKTS